jgi:hypothetical protein
LTEALPAVPRRWNDACRGPPGVDDTAYDNLERATTGLRAELRHRMLNVGTPGSPDWSTLAVAGREMIADSAAGLGRPGPPRWRRAHHALDPSGRPASRGLGRAPVAPRNTPQPESSVSAMFEIGVAHARLMRLIRTHPIGRRHRFNGAFEGNLRYMSATSVHNDTSSIAPPVGGSSLIDEGRCMGTRWESRGLCGLPHLAPV